MEVLLHRALVGDVGVLPEGGEGGHVAYVVEYVQGESADGHRVDPGPAPDVPVEDEVEHPLGDHEVVLLTHAHVHEGLSAYGDVLLEPLPVAVLVRDRICLQELLEREGVEGGHVVVAEGVEDTAVVLGCGIGQDDVDVESVSLPEVLYGAVPVVDEVHVVH